MMKAADVMVSEVITVAPDASVHEVAEILLANRISALPVVGVDGELVGIVSEGDLIRRIESETERRPSRWLALLMGNRGLAAEFVKSHALKVADFMTREVVTASPDTRLRDIAALMEKKRIKRVPIMRWTAGRNCEPCESGSGAGNGTPRDKGRYSHQRRDDPRGSHIALEVGALGEAVFASTSSFTMEPLDCGAPSNPRRQRTRFVSPSN
jgi:CBS domain-containing protein